MSAPGGDGHRAQLWHAGRELAFPRAGSSWPLAPRADHGRARHDNGWGRRVAEAPRAGPSMRKPMSLGINDVAPDFTADTTEGEIKFHDRIGEGWAALFSHPKDFTPVRTIELGYMARIKPELDKRSTKIIGLSVDPVANHKKWADDIKETQGTAPNDPMIGDPEVNIAKLYNMLSVEEPGTSEGRTAANNATVRTVFVVGPDKKIKLMLTYPMTTGRNFDEVLRVTDSMQLTAKHKVATPVNWKKGDDVIIVASVSDEEAKSMFPKGWQALRPCLRFTKQPRA
jgi:alkyl hydroperoxide reductase subunit AhpC